MWRAYLKFTAAHIRVLLEVELDIAPGLWKSRRQMMLARDTRRSDVKIVAELITRLR